MTTADEQAAKLAREIRNIGRGVLGFLLLGLLLLAGSQGWGFWQLPAILGLGLFASGALVGFLFGIPKVGTPEKNNEKTAQARLVPNTNLEQISDWLTKIIVGLGLVQLNKLPAAMLRFTAATRPAFHLWADSAPLGVAIYFPVLGFVSGWLITRLYLSGLILRADVQLTEQSPETKQAIAAVQESIVTGTSAKLSQHQLRALRENDKKLKNKPESEYTAQDWLDRAYVAYLDKKLALAAEYFAQAARARGATPSQVAMGLVFQGVIAVAFGSNEKAVASFDEVISRFRNTSDPALRRLVAIAMRNKGVALDNLGRWDDALAGYADLLKAFGGDADPDIRDSVAGGMFNKGWVLTEQGHHDASLLAYNEVIERFEGAAEPELRRHVARAMANKASALDHLRRPDEVLEAYDKLIARYKDVQEPEIQKIIVVALEGKGEVLGRRGDTQNALAIFNDLLERYKNSDAPDIQDIMVQVQFARAVTLHLLGNPEAVAALKDLVARKSDSGNEEVAKILATARTYLADPAGHWEYLDASWR